jgi:tetratricopeptide (TPR) repeat protein
MIPFLLLLQAAPDAAPDRQAACLALASEAPAQAIAEAGAWRVAGGGYRARQCLGVAYAAQERWSSAAGEFEAAAREAEAAKSPFTADLWMQAGNARLAGGETPQARAAFEAALALNTLTGPALGEVHLDRARALAADGDLVGARTSIDQATALVPQDPLAWLLSATLARREGDLMRAGRDILKALEQAPDDASVRLEAGNIAAFTGDETGARSHWTAAVTSSPESSAGKSAKAALAQFAAAP